MDDKNWTLIKVVHLLGFQTPHSVTHLIFFLFLMVYCLTICGNLLIIALVIASRTLHAPMYFFLSQLSVSDILLTTDIFPNLLQTVLVKDTIITFSACITQFYFFCMSETSECLLLTTMSYDRYLAICKPLHYPLIMSHQFCWIMVITIWSLSLLIGLMPAITISELQFCGPNTIDHFFCDLVPILELSCSETIFVQLEVKFLNGSFVAVPFLVIIVSYVYIVVTIFEIPSITGRKKVFSTCSSHLTVVSIFYGTLVCVYLIPNRGQSWDISKLLSLLYTVVTPLMNPVIYSLRNKDLRKALQTIINNKQIIA
ncbi:olfactory receptor 11L1-like [Gastrophryne carolinensis]